jgi:TolB protein
MKIKFKIQNPKSKAALIILLSWCIFYFTFFIAEAKVYIDISSPASTRLPIAVQEFPGPSGGEITDIIRNDLDYTGLFMLINKSAYVEDPSQQFNPKNWTPLGVEAVVKGSVGEGKELVVIASCYDVFEGKEIFRKEYKAEKHLLRPLAHSIANDIYFSLTGDSGMFRSRIAYVAEEKGEKALSIMDWDGNRVTKTGLKAPILMSPRWSRDGTKIVYSAEKNRQWGIYLLNFSSMKADKIFFSQGTNIAGDFTSDGDELFFSSSKEGTPDLYSLTLKNSRLKKLTSSYGINVSPAVSPDSGYIAFVSDRGGSPQIYIMRRDGSDVKRITFEGSYNTSPCWSPKGDKIIFAGRRGTNQIFMVNPDGTGLTQLTSQGNNEDPSFSSDGRYITFTSDREGGKGIYIMRANGENQKRITPRNLKAYAPRWAPM